MALISDGYLGVQEVKARALSLDRWISVRVFTDAMGRDHWKPSPWAFQEVMRRLPGEPSGFVYVGDNPRKDFIGARAVGWKTVRVRWPGCEHSGAEAPAEHAADLELSSLLGLKALVAPAGEYPEGDR
jgi:putative hydrolase of the HAD superfamily